jgi:hypothetical protein
MHKNKSFLKTVTLCLSATFICGEFAFAANTAKPSFEDIQNQNQNGKVIATIIANDPNFGPELDKSDNLIKAIDKLSEVIGNSTEDSKGILSALGQWSDVLQNSANKASNSKDLQELRTSISKNILQELSYDKIEDIAPNNAEAKEAFVELMNLVHE